MKPCQGLGGASSVVSRRGARTHVQPCVYDACAGDVLCTFHRKLVDGLITELAPGVPPSWPPPARGKPPAEPKRDLRERLREEWAL